MNFIGIPGAGRALAPPVGLVAASLLGGAAVWLASPSSRWFAIAAVSTGLFGLYRLAQALHAIFEVRRRADDWLRTSRGGIVPPAYAWRAAQLTSPEQRRLLARTIRLVVRSTRERSIGTLRPRLLAVRKQQGSLETLAERLEHEAEPVTPAGMLRVVELVTDGTGPLWGTSDEALGVEIETTLDVLLPRAA